MSKKRFTKGFDLFFGGEEPAGDTFVIEENKIEVQVKPKPKKVKKVKSSKKFSTGLESIFMDNILDEPKPTSKSTKSKPKSFVGLDQLIRSTIDVSKLNTSDAETKRLTILLEIEKIEALRKIAKSEKVRLKNIIRQIVADYLDEKA